VCSTTPGSTRAGCPTRTTSIPAATSRSARLSTARFDGAAASTFSPRAAARRITSTNTVVLPVPGGPCTSMTSCARSASSTAAFCSWLSRVVRMLRPSASARRRGDPGSSVPSRGRASNRGGSPRSTACHLRASRIRRTAPASRSQVADDGCSSKITRPSLAQSGSGSSNAMETRERCLRATIPLGASCGGASRLGSTRTMAPAPSSWPPSSRPPGRAKVTSERPASPPSSTASTSESASPLRMRSTSGRRANRSFSAARSLSSSVSRASRCCTRSIAFPYTRRIGGAHGHDREARDEAARGARRHHGVPRGREGDGREEDRLDSGTGRRPHRRRGHRARPGHARPGRRRQRRHAHRRGHAHRPAPAADRHQRGRVRGGDAHPVHAASAGGRERTGGGHHLHARRHPADAGRQAIPHRAAPDVHRRPMKFVMMGSGGVGGYYGARLQQAGHGVAFVARGAHAEAMRRSGLRVRSELGDAQLKVRVLDEPAQAGPADLVFVAVKLWDTEAAARAVAAVPGAAVVSLQNGVDKDDVLSAALGRERVLGGVTHIATVVAEPGVIAHTGKLQRMTLGELDGSRTPRLSAICDALRSAGVEIVQSDDVRRATWEKFIFLSALSGLTALTRKPIGEVRAHPATRALLLDALREATAVARAEGARLDESFAQKQLELVDAFPPTMLSSMAHDLLRGNRLELPWLSGAVVQRAEKHHIAVPAHRTIYAALVLHAG